MTMYVPCMQDHVHIIIVLQALYTCPMQECLVPDPMYVHVGMTHLVYMPHAGMSHAYTCHPMQEWSKTFHHKFIQLPPMEPSLLRHHKRKNTSLLEETGDQHMQPMNITITHSPKQRNSTKPNVLSNISIQTGPTTQFTSAQLSRESIGQVNLKKMRPHPLITTRHKTGGKSGFRPFQIETILKGKGLAIAHKCDTKQQFAEARHYQSHLF